MRKCGNCSGFGHNLATCDSPGAQNTKSARWQDGALKNAEVRREKTRAWKASNPNAYAEWMSAHPGKAEFYEGRRDHDARNAEYRENYAAVPERYRLKSKLQNLSKLYGINQEQYDYIFEFQGRVCACCGRSDPGSVRDWCVEHNHETGQIRGITCHHCNVRLGGLGDDPDGVALHCLQLLDYLYASGELVSTEVCAALTRSLTRSANCQAELV